MSESQANLIEQRDELIERLQGQWEIEADKRKTNRLALRAGGLIFVGGVVFMALLLLVSLPFMEAEKELGIGSFMLVMAPFLGVFAMLTYASIQFYGMWWRRLNPLVIDGSQLVWNKKKGHVPERLNLHNLTQVHGYEGQYMDGGVLLVWIMKYFDKSTFDSVNPCVFASKGDHNLPKIAPGMFKEGKQLIDLLVQIASINTQLEELTQESSG